MNFDQCQHCGGFQAKCVLFEIEGRNVRRVLCQKCISKNKKALTSEASFCTKEDEEKASRIARFVRVIIASVWDR